MPAEWEPHEATWLAWPHNPEDWPGKVSDHSVGLCGDCAAALAARERVHILVDDAKAEARARSILSAPARVLDQVSFHRWPTNRVWTRDSGPIFVRNGRASGGHELAIQCMGQVRRLATRRPGARRVPRTAGPARVAAGVEVEERRTKRRLVLEGGSIDTNGAGILLTTEECLLSEVQQRNPGVSREQLEQAFHDYSRHRPGDLARPRQLPATIPTDTSTTFRASLGRRRL
jgi:agmatine deiminase